MRFLVVYTLTTVFFVGNWLLDVGNVATQNKGQFITLTNGLWTLNAVLVSHAGWYLAGAAFLLLGLYTIRLEDRLASIQERNT